MPSLKTRHFPTILLILLIGACVSAPTSRTTYVDDDYSDSNYGNFLVIGVAGSYNNRAEFERQVVSGLRGEGVDATAFYNLAGNEPISRDGVLEAVRANGFDAVLITRILGQQRDIGVEEGSTGAKASTIGGRPINFFRYDYEELNEPDSINFTMTVTLTTELFSAGDEKMIWAIETSSSDAENAGILIETTAESIVKKLARDGLVGS